MAEGTVCVLLPRAPRRYRLPARNDESIIFIVYRRVAASRSSRASRADWPNRPPPSPPYPYYSICFFHRARFARASSSSVRTAIIFTGNSDRRNTSRRSFGIHRLNAIAFIDDYNFEIKNGYDYIYVGIAKIALTISRQRCRVVRRWRPSRRSRAKSSISRDALESPRFIEAAAPGVRFLLTTLARHPAPSLSPARSAPRLCVYRSIRGTKHPVEEAPRVNEKTERASLLVSGRVYRGGPSRCRPWPTISRCQRTVRGPSFLSFLVQEPGNRAGVDARETR